MLYTSMPLDRIYNNQVNSLIIPSNRQNQAIYQSESAKWNESSEDMNMKLIELPHGRIYAKKQGAGYIVHSVQSTNFEDYLSTEYNIGNEIKVD